MKIRNGLVSNSSTMSFWVNGLMYSGVITTPILIGLLIYQKQEMIKKILKWFTQKSVNKSSQIKDTVLTK